MMTVHVPQHDSADPPGRFAALIEHVADQAHDSAPLPWMEITSASSL
jgi:hypothetical protein